jgi:hypothetical protein
MGTCAIRLDVAVEQQWKLKCRVILSAEYVLTLDIPRTDCGSLRRLIVIELRAIWKAKGNLGDGTSRTVRGHEDSRGGQQEV